MSAAHQDARVILTLRDPGRWYDSIQQTIFPFFEALDADGGTELRAEVISTHTFDGRLSDREHCLEVFARHNQAVREAIAPERLLVFDLKAGWAPLCAFLDVPVPANEPFPRVNDIAQFQLEAGLSSH